MRINADFKKRAAVVADDAEWIQSPEVGVDRKMLDRIGAEVARATSIVRYAPGSRFATHAHAKGEEFLVLDGVFSDESGDYPAGSYVRNPPGSSHAPFSDSGCQILVKLRQFDPQDLAQIAIDSCDKQRWIDDGGRLPLHEFGPERVSMLRAGAGDTLPLLGSDGGAELFIVNGELLVDGTAYPENSWLRFPPGDAAQVEAARATTVWFKAGHLAALV
jgi:anti-sigma factor ChrR (cupin superfamily)